MNISNQPKKKSPLIWIAPGAALVLAAALYMAVVTGQKSPLYAAGSIELSSELEPAAKGMRTLYIVALPPAESGMRMPLGAARFNVSGDATGRFLNFSLTPETMQMMPGASGGTMPAKFRRKARLDADGAGGMDQPGDLVGEVSQVASGSRDVVITINRVASGVMAP